MSLPVSSTEPGTHTLTLWKGCFRRASLSAGTRSAVGECWQSITGSPGEGRQTHTCATRGQADAHTCDKRAGRQSHVCDKRAGTLVWQEGKQTRVWQREGKHTCATRGQTHSHVWQEGMQTRVTRGQTHLCDKREWRHVWQEGRHTHACDKRAGTHTRAHTHLCIFTHSHPPHCAHWSASHQNQRLTHTDNSDPYSASPQNWN